MQESGVILHGFIERLDGPPVPGMLVAVVLRHCLTIAGDGVGVGQLARVEQLSQDGRQYRPDTTKITSELFPVHHFTDIQHTVFCFLVPTREKCLATLRAAEAAEPITDPAGQDLVISPAVFIDTALKAITNQ